LITNQQLIETFLTPQMEGYFQEKLSHVPQHELAVQLEECLKFLFIAHLCPGNIPVTQAIDDVWHLWILETVEYCRLCSSLADETIFITHPMSLRVMPVTRHPKIPWRMT
jgi:hypothetical protein